MFNKVFDDIEHLYIFSSESIQRLVNSSGAKVVGEEEWCVAQEIIVIQK